MAQAKTFAGSVTSRKISVGCTGQQSCVTFAYNTQPDEKNKMRYTIALPDGGGLLERSCDPLYQDVAADFACLLRREGITLCCKNNTSSTTPSNEDIIKQTLDTLTKPSVAKTTVSLERKINNIPTKNTAVNFTFSYNKDNGYYRIDMGNNGKDNTIYMGPHPTQEEIVGINSRLYEHDASINLPRNSLSIMKELAKSIISPPSQGRGA